MSTIAHIRSIRLEEERIVGSLLLKIAGVEGLRRIDCFLLEQ